MRRQGQIGHVAGVGARLAAITAVLCLAGGAQGVVARVTPRPAHAVVDISATAVGQRLVDAAVHRMGGSLAGAAGRDWHAYADASGVTIAPAGTAFARVRGGGAQEWAPLVRQPARQGAAAVQPRVAEQSLSGAVDPNWVSLGSGCFERVTDNWAWIDHCYQLFGLERDGDPQRDTYALVRTATAGPNWPWVIKSASIASQPMGGVAQTWRDWSPRSDHGGPCGQVTLSVRAPLPEVTVAAERCETWNITKGSAGGAFALAWSGCACTEDRELASVIAISVPQGSAVGWVLPASVVGFAF